MATRRVLMSLNVTLADFPLMVPVALLWKQLPRTVRVALPAAETVVGPIVPIPKGTAAS